MYIIQNNILHIIKNSLCVRSYYIMHKPIQHVLLMCYAHVTYKNDIWLSVYQNDDSNIPHDKVSRYVKHNTIRGKICNIIVEVKVKYVI